MPFNRKTAIWARVTEDPGISGAVVGTAAGDAGVVQALDVFPGPVVEGHIFKGEMLIHRIGFTACEGQSRQRIREQVGDAGRVGTSSRKEPELEAEAV